MMSKSKMKYVFEVPTTVPAKRVLVHNSAHDDRGTVPGTEDFRAWFDVPHRNYVMCSCGWASHLDKHYCERQTKGPEIGEFAPDRFAEFSASAEPLHLSPLGGGE
jgi:hypothetical protein